VGAALDADEDAVDPDDAAVVEEEDFDELEHAPATTAASTAGITRRSKRGDRNMGVRSPSRKKKVPAGAQCTHKNAEAKGTYMGRPGTPRRRKVNGG
jgi:hypothetical protein